MKNNTDASVKNSHNTAGNKYSRFERKSFPFVYLMIAFPVLQFAVFWVGVNFSSIGLAFQDTAGSFTFNNIKNVLTGFWGTAMGGYDLLLSLKNSFTIWSVSNLICFPLSIITTYVLYKRILGHYVLRICFIIPSLMGVVMWTSLVKFMVQYNGIVVNALKGLNIKLPDEVLENGLFASRETAFKTILALNVIMGFVGNNAVLTGAFSRVPEELYESAELDGAGFWTICFKIAIPCVWSTISMLMIFALCSIFTADANIWLYTQGTGEPGMSTIGFVLYNMTYVISLNGGGSYGFPAALGLILTLITMPIVLFGRKLLAKIQETVEV